MARSGKAFSPGSVAMPDISALFTLSVNVEAMLGVLLLYTWVQNINIKAVAWWGAAHLLCAGSILLFALYGQLPNDVIDDISII